MATPTGGDENDGTAESEQPTDRPKHRNRRRTGEGHRGRGLSLWSVQFEAEDRGHVEPEIGVETVAVEYER